MKKLTDKPVYDFMTDIVILKMVLDSFIDTTATIQALNTFDKMKDVKGCFIASGFDEAKFKELENLFSELGKVIRSDKFGEMTSMNTKGTTDLTSKKNDEFDNTSYEKICTENDNELMRTGLVIILGKSKRGLKILSEVHEVRGVKDTLEEFGYDQTNLHILTTEINKLNSIVTDPAFIDKIKTIGENKTEGDTNVK